MSEGLVESPTEIKEASKSFLDGMKPAPKETPAASEPPAWFITANMPGNGDRPDWLLPKYENMEEQARAYPGLEKKFGSRDVAPAEYDFTPFKEELDLNNPALQEFVAFSKEKNLSQEVVGTMVDKFVKYSKSKEPNFDEEVQKLGPNANERIETVRRWAENNFSESALNVIGQISKSAAAIEFLDELRQYQFHTSSQPPTANQMNSGFVKLTTAEVESEMKQNFKRYNEDKSYRDEISRKFAQALGEG